MTHDNKRIVCDSNRGSEKVKISGNIEDIVNESVVLLIECWTRQGRTADNKMTDAYIKDFLLAAATELGFMPVNYGVAKCVGMTECPDCSAEFDWKDARWSIKDGKKKNRAICPVCGSYLQTSRMSAWINFDSENDLVEGSYQVPTTPCIEQIICAEKGSEYYVEQEEGEKTITDERLQTLLKPGMSADWFKKYVEITMSDVEGELTQGDIAKQLGMTDAELSDLLITYKTQAQKLFGKQTTFRKEQKKSGKEQPQMSLFDCF